jgi:hypothetical protein
LSVAIGETTRACLFPPPPPSPSAAAVLAVLEMALMMPSMPVPLLMESAAPAAMAAVPTIGVAPLAGMAVWSWRLEVLLIVGSAAGGNKVK